MTKSNEKIAIVGGGIGGLFCAYILCKEGKSVVLFEATKRVGGRIRTLRLNKNNEPLNAEPPNQWTSKNLEFYAEFGPMRIEPDKQLLVKALLDHLEINAESTGNKAYLKDFPAYASPESAHDPQYELRPDEIGKAPLELLRMALLRVIVHLDVEGPNSHFSDERDKLVNQISVAAATQESVDLIFVEWMKTLNEQHYWDIQVHGKVELRTKNGVLKVPLYSMGFWNLLSDYLSYDAILKLRDLGTFYHLLTENPNAAEWVVWWLLGFATTERLQGICGGMECIIDELQKKLQNFAGNKLTQHLGCLVAEVRSHETKPQLLDLYSDVGEILGEAFDRVILALPKCSLEKIAYKNRRPFEAEPHMFALLDSAFAFPMVKLFVVVKNRWWQEENRANWYATRLPTREIHYWKGLTEDSKQGLIMLYTDRPASAFWANYVPPGNQDDVRRAEKGSFLNEELRHRLTKKIVQYINESNVPNITPEDVVWYGIRDWAREPYGGANHAWRPERKYWVVIRRLADIRAKSRSLPSIHVCGEAYSDYHGFMEGSLRSAVYSLHRILDKVKNHERYVSGLSWLEKAGIRVEGKYLDRLNAWVTNLDNIDVEKEKFLYEAIEDTLKKPQ